MSGWATITVETVSEEAAETLAGLLREIAEKDRDIREPNGSVVRALDWGYGIGASEKVLKQNTHLWDTAVIMECNDTSDSGSGHVFESEGESIEKVTTAHGVEQARGHDAKADVQHHIDAAIYMR